MLPSFKQFNRSCGKIFVREKVVTFVSLITYMWSTIQILGSYKYHRVAILLVWIHFQWFGSTYMFELKYDVFRNFMKCYIPIMLWNNLPSFGLVWLQNRLSMMLHFFTIKLKFENKWITRKMRSFVKEIRSFLFSKKIKCLILSKDNWLING